MISFSRLPNRAIHCGQFVLMVGAIASLSSCAAPPSPTASPGSPKPRVVATTTVLCDMVNTIAADTVDLTCLQKAGVDSHVYEPVPADRKAIETAQLILYSGYNLEPSLIKLIQSTSNTAPKVAVAELAVPKPLLGAAHHHAGEAHADEAAHAGAAHADEKAHSDAESHADEKGHTGAAPTDEAAAGATTPDPHVWQNAEHGAQMVAVVQAKLTDIAPENRDRYTQSATALKTELNQIHTWIKSQIATIPTSSRKLVTTHEAMAYYANAYQIPVLGVLQGLSTDEKPTAATLQAIVDEVKAAQVPTIFAEVVVNPKLIQTVAREAGIQLAEQPLYSDSLGEPGSPAETYPKLLIANTKAIVEGLKGQYVPFQPNPANSTPKSPV